MLTNFAVVIIITPNKNATHVVSLEVLRMTICIILA